MKVFKMLSLLLFAIIQIGSPDVVLGKATFEDCGGPNKKLTIKSGSVKPDPILYPGNVSVTANVDVTEDLPSTGLKMRLNLTKLEPREMHVPCLKDIGSCEYDVCDMIQNHKSVFCPMFPPGIKCGCPMKKAAYNLENALVVIPNFGEIFKLILKGNYKGTINFIDDNSDAEIGCIAVTFNIQPSS